MQITSSPEPSPAARASIGTTAYLQLRELLFSGQLAAGSVIQERRLAEMLGLSRTPVREALQRLDGEGFLVRQDRHLRVVAITVSEVMEILAVRQSLESDATWAACGRMPRPVLTEIRGRIEAMTDPSAVNDEEHWGVDDMLHLAIAHGSGNRLLQRLISELRQKTRLFGLRRIPARFEPGKIEHLAILDALEAGDADLAATRMRAHMGHVREAIIGALAVGRA